MSRSFWTNLVLTLLAVVTATPAQSTFESKRPPVAQRKFRSEAVEEVIAKFKKECADPELAWLFENCYPNTLDTTVFHQELQGQPDTYVITGDIDAMWLRDSSAQVHPYLPLCKKDRPLARMIEGLIRRQNRCILHDPYANAFYKDEKQQSQWKNDQTDMKLGVHERKWEIDSLCYPIRLAYEYWKITGDTAPFDDTWVQAMKLVVATMKDQQRKDGPGSYKFQRKTERATDSLSGGGYGNPWKANGMIVTAFRNSDDAALYPFNIPANLFAVTSLRQLAEMMETVKKDKEFALAGRALATEVEAAMKKHGIVKHPVMGEIYAYEVDGFGNVLFMDDAGNPSLVSIPYFGYGGYQDPLYLRTRAFALSPSNPYFYQSKIAEGTGGPHVHRDKMIWPIGIMTRAITSQDEKEIRFCVDMLKRTHAGTGFMHETFHRDNPQDFTRDWFAWANTLFGEMLLKAQQEHPKIFSKK